MADIFTGTGVTVYYNKDTANRSPQGVGNVFINELNTFPVLTVQSESNSYETYDSDYNSKLLSDKTVEPIGISVNYIPDDESHSFLDEAALNQTVFQLVIHYNLAEGNLTYSLMNGAITETMVNGDKDTVVSKTYTFTPTEVLVTMATVAALLPIYQGDFGLGSDTTTIPQYAPDLPTGNSFIKVPSDQDGNPAAADMMGIGWVDGTNISSLAVTKTGTLSIYAKNGSTAWSRIYTSSQMDNRYNQISNNLSDVADVPTARTNLDVYSKEEVNDISDTLDGTIRTLSDATTSSFIEVHTEVTKLSSDLNTTISDLSDELNTTISDISTDLNTKITTLSESTNASVSSIETEISTLSDKTDSHFTTVETSVNTLSDKLDSDIANVNSNISTNYATKTELNDDVATLVPKTTTINGHSLNDNVTLTSTDTGSLAIANNLSDLSDVSAARSTLNVSALSSTGGYTFLGSPGTTRRLVLADDGTYQFQDQNGNVLPLNIDSGGTGARTAAEARQNLGLEIVDKDSDYSFLFSPDFTRRVIVGDNDDWGYQNATTGARIPLTVENGGTGASTKRDAQLNLGLGFISAEDSTQTTIGSPDGSTLFVIPTNSDNWGMLHWNGTGYDQAPLGIYGGGTGATDATNARINLGVGDQQLVNFGGLNANTYGLVNGGIYTSQRLDSTGATLLSYSRFYHEIQSDVAKTTLHTCNQSTGANAYLQFDEAANLTGISKITANGVISSAGFTTNGYVTASQGNRVGVNTQTGGNKDIYLSNVGGDSSVNNWINLIQGNWYDGYWQLGGVRGNGSDFDHIKLGVNNQGTDWKEFKFYTSYNGHIVVGGGYRAPGFSRGWQSDADYMGASFYADTVTGNDGGYNPIVAGGTQSSGGYGTRASFGLISGGTANWPSMALHMLGDATYHRGFTFSMDGNITSWDSPDGTFGGSFVFSRAATSDKNVKTDIVYTDGKESYDRVMKWLPTMFKFTGQDTQRYGLIAQDLMEIDPQYVITVKGSPKFELVEEVDEETGETKTVSKDTGEFNPDTLALDNNVVMVDMACALRYLADKQQKEIDELKELVQSLMDK